MCPLMIWAARQLRLLLPFERCEALNRHRPSFTAGLEVSMVQNIARAKFIRRVGQGPALVQVSEMGGVLSQRVGRASRPGCSLSRTKTSLISQPQETGPFRGLAASANANSQGNTRACQACGLARAPPQILNGGLGDRGAGPTSAHKHKLFPACSSRKSQVAS